jgi:hypothetical protein
MYIVSFLTILLALCPLLRITPLNFGFFHENDFVATFVFVIAGLSAILAYKISKKHPFIIEKSFGTPLVFFNLLLFLYYALQSLFVPNLLQNWFSYNDTCDGALLFLAQAILSVMIYINFSFNKTKIKNILLSLIVILGCIIIVLGIIGSNDSPIKSLIGNKYMLFCFPDFVAFVSIAMIMYFNRYQTKKSPTIIWGVFSLIMVMSFLYSQNAALHYSIFLSIFLIIGAKFFDRYVKLETLPLLYVVFLLGISTVIIFFKQISQFVYVPSNLMSRANLSLITLVHYVKDFKLSDSINVLFGNGCASFHNFNIKNLYLLSDFQLFAKDAWQPNWENIVRNLISTHNTVTENFCNGGLVGVFLYLSYQYFFIKSSKNLLSKVYIMSLGIISSLWFQFIFTMPFTIIALALVKQKSIIKIPIIYIRKILLFTSLVLCTAGIFYGVNSEKNNLVIKSNDSIEDKIKNISSVSCAKFDVWIGGFRVLEILKHVQEYNKKYIEQIINPNLSNNEKRNSLKLYLQNLEDVENFLQKNHALDNLATYVLLINMYNDLFVYKEVFLLDQKLIEPFLKKWESLTKGFLEKCPYRSDMMIVILNHYLSFNKPKELLDMLKNIMIYDDKNPIASWFWGSYYLKNPKTFNDGIKKIKLSIENGINRFIPVPKDIIEKFS